MTKKSKLVVFRADASVQIGTGHIMRCLTLADELTRQGYECRFICRDHQGHLGELIASKGFAIDLLVTPSEGDPNFLNDNGIAHAQWLGVSWQLDAAQTLSLLESLAAEWLVVDHYSIDARWEREVRQVVGRIMVIDDLADRKHHADLLLDQNLGRSVNEYETLAPNQCIRLVGPQYALLRPEFRYFRARSIHRRRNTKLSRILISMGGMDLPSTTSSVLRALESSDLPSTIELDVIMGSQAPGLNKVTLLSERSRFDNRVSTDVFNMAERMCRADLSIGAAGSTTWERCVLGLPSIAVSQAFNQSAILDALCAAGAAEKLEFPFDDQELVSILNRFIKSPEKLAAMARYAAKICDGRGVGRVFERLNAKKQ